MMRILWYLIIILLYGIGVTIFMVCKWAKGTFDVGLNAIINTLFSPLKGTSSDTVIPAVKYCLPVVLAVLFLCILYIILDNKYRNKKVRAAVTVLGVAAIAGSLSYVQLSYDVIGYIVTSRQETSVYKEYYTAPADVTIEAPEEKRNLLYIYLESMETTYASKEEGSVQEVNYIPFLTRLAEENVSFSNSEQLGGLRPVNGATWTMGALFSSTAGIPFAFPVGKNDMEGESVFASGVYTLGDFLKSEGYMQEFLCGSDATFAGRRTYLQQHGEYEIFDLYTAREKGYIPEDYFVWWGFEDTILYEIAKDELLRLSEIGEPFNLTMLTADLHHIGGYECELCTDEYEDITANIAACSDRQLNEFIEWCREQDFYDNTTIVIVGDHPRMDTHLVEGITYEDRTLYNCFINSVYKEEPNTVNREASAIDLFPTILSALGYEIEGEQLGMGVNLFSGKETLSEELGFDYLNHEFEKRSNYYVNRFAPELSHLVEDEETAICTIYFDKNNYNADEYIAKGVVEGYDGTYSWLEGKEIPVSIPIKKNIDKVHISIHVTGVVDAQYYYILQGEEILLDGAVNATEVLEFDAGVEDGMCEFVLNIPNAVSPYELGLSDDTREITLKLTHITVNIVEEQEE